MKSPAKKPLVGKQKNLLLKCLASQVWKWWKKVHLLN
jgi:hypothetical protein